MIYEIIPGILEKDWEGVEEKIKLLSPFATKLHIDIADNKLANNLTFLEAAPFTPYKDKFFLELHMMVENPIDYLDDFAEAGFRRMLGNIEGMEDPYEFIERCRELGVEAGLALDGPTPVEELFDYLEEVDCFNCYVSEKMGFSGPPMLPERLEKVKVLRAKTNLPIEIDGGVKDHTIKLAKEAGANRFVATSFISAAPDPHKAYLALQEATA